MKILFDVTELSYYNENSGHKAGVFFVALNLLKEFKNMDVDVTLYCTKRLIPKAWSKEYLKNHNIPVRPIYQQWYQYHFQPLHLH